MEKVFSVVTDFFGKMTALFMGLLSFGIIADVLFGDTVFGMVYSILRCHRVLLILNFLSNGLR